MTVGGTVLMATSGDADPATWSVQVPADAAALVEGDVTVTVDATKAGFTAAVQVARTLTVDLTAPTATWTLPATLKVGVAIDALTPATDDTDIETWEATGLPPGLAIDAGTGALSGTPTAANAATATATATVTDRAGNPGTADIAFPAVSKGTQDLSAFAYAAATVTYGDLAPTVIAPTGVPTTLSYAATPATVCTVDSSTGELTLHGAGICTITATAASDDNYDEGTATATVTVQPAGTLTLNLDPIATDNTVNFAEQELGFIISGDTGSEGGVSVTVRVGTEELTDTSSATSTPAAWSVIVLARSAYLTDSNVTVTVSASKTGFTSPGDLTRTVTVDLTAPTAPTYTAPDALKVGEAITAMSPSGGTDVDGYSATGLPSGLTIDAGTGVIRGTPDMAADAASTTVTVTDSAGNPATVSIPFPEVAKGDQTLARFAYSPATVTFGDAAPTLTAPTGVQTTLSYSAAPADVCTVDTTSGELMLVGTGTCTITATADSDDNYEAATATATVTVQPAGTLALNLDAIAGDNTINIAEKADGFAISGDTGSEAGVSVQLVMDGRASGGGVTTVVVPSPSATSGTSTRAIWSYRVASGELDQSLNEPSVRVVVQATKTGFTLRLVRRTVTVDLTAPTAPTYTAPTTLTVGVAITDMDPSGGIDIASYSATDLPPGLSIDSTTGVISGTPDTAATTATITVTVTDTAENPATVSIPFPEVAKAEQPLTDFAYSPATVTFGDDAPTFAAPTGAQGTLSYAAAPAEVCTVNATSGALTLDGAGDCIVTATAEETANYIQTTADFTVTVAKGEQPLTGFDYSPATVMFGDAAPTLTAPPGAQGTLSYAATPAEVCTVNATSGALTLDGLGDCVVTATAEETANYIQATDDFTVTVAKGEQPLTGFGYSPATVNFGDAAPTLTAHTGAQGTLSYAATPAEVCTVNATSGALTLDGVGDCVVTATAESTANYNQVTADFTVTVAKGDQTLTGFGYSSDGINYSSDTVVTLGDPALFVAAPAGAQTTLSYSATPPDVCTVDDANGALMFASMIEGSATCTITVTAAGTDNYNEATATATVTVRGTLALNLDPIAGDDTVNIAEKAAGFMISGNTGSEPGVTVGVDISNAVSELILNLETISGANVAGRVFRGLGRQRRLVGKRSGE